MRSWRCFGVGFQLVFSLKIGENKEKRDEKEANEADFE
jgi:hypothetical protein